MNCMYRSKYLVMKDINVVISVIVEVGYLMSILVVVAVKVLNR